MSRPASLLKLEQDAYYAVLRALAVNELDWVRSCYSHLRDEAQDLSALRKIQRSPCPWVGTRVASCTAFVRKGCAPNTASAAYVTRERCYSAVQTKEKLLTDLRKVLNISNDQHFQFLEEVMEDKLVLRLQDLKNNPAAAPPAPAPAYEMPPPPRQSGSAAQLHRKIGRPASANLKNQGSVTPPLGPRTSRYVIHHLCNNPVATCLNPLKQLISCYRCPR